MQKKSAQYEMHMTKIDLPEEKRAKLVKLLNARLADLIDLQMQAKQAHWNVKGPQFYGLHLLFDQVYEQAAGWIDTTAERCMILGGTAEGTVQAVSGRTELEPYPLDIFTCRAHVDSLSSALADVGGRIREAISQSEELEDADTADMFTEISRGIDKQRWFVEAHLQADE